MVTLNHNCEKRQDRWRDAERKMELPAVETDTGVQTEMSDESEAFWEDTPV